MSQRQFRSDDTSKWLFGFGSGVDGDLTVSSNATDAPVDSACSGSAGSTSLSATNAGFASGQMVLIHQSQGSGAGQWELNRIQSYVSGTITLVFPLINTYASGAQVLVMKQYKNVVTNAGVSLSAKAWNGTVGGILAFFANQSVVNSGNFNIAEKGFRGGNGVANHGSAYQGESYLSLGTVSTLANGNAGGGGSGNDASGGGGGNGLSGTTGGNYGGTIGAAGGIGGNSNLTLMVFGGGGGGGAEQNTPACGAGGVGGGILLIVTPSFTTPSGGTISASGAKGGSSYESHATGSGGGGGGNVLVKGQHVSLGSGVTVANGGAGGDDGSRVGGTGGVGRVHVDYNLDLSGTSVPTLTSALDYFIRRPYVGGSFMQNFC